MPGITTDPSSLVFWSTEDVLNFARVLVNDAQASLAGDELADSAPYTWTLLNLCYGKLQNTLEDSNVESASLAEDRVLLPQGEISPDPTAQSRLSYGEFVDATGSRYEFPTLPQGLLEPLNVWERIGGSNDPFRLIPQRLGGMGPWWDPNCFGSWEFRENSLFLAGNPNGRELRIRFIPSWPALVQPTNGAPAPVVRLARSGEALAYLLAAEFAEIRNAANAPMLRMKANEQLTILANKSAKRENQSDTRRKGYGFRRRRRAWPV